MKLAKISIRISRIPIHNKRKLITIRHPRRLEGICNNHLGLGTNLLIVVGKKLWRILCKFLVPIFHF